MFKLILFMSLLAHWSGCLQFLLPAVEGFPPNSWVAVNELEVERALFSHCLIDWGSIQLTQLAFQLSFQLRFTCSTSSRKVNWVNLIDSLWSVAVWEWNSEWRCVCVCAL